SIHDNDVALGSGVGSTGIFVFVPYVNVSVADNTISGVDIGLAAEGGAGGTAAFSGNDVDVNAGGTGALVTTNISPFGFANVSASFSGDSFTHGATGIAVDQSAGGTASASISNVTINDPAIGIDINGGTATISGGNIFNNTT